MPKGHDSRLSILRVEAGASISRSSFGRIMEYELHIDPRNNTTDRVFEKIRQKSSLSYTHLRVSPTAFNSFRSHSLDRWAPEALSVLATMSV